MVVRKRLNIGSLTKEQLEKEKKESSFKPYFPNPEAHKKFVEAMFEVSNVY